MPWFCCLVACDLAEAKITKLWMSVEAQTGSLVKSESDPDIHPVLALERPWTHLNVFSQLIDHRNHVSDTHSEPAAGRTSIVALFMGVWYRGSTSDCPKLSVPSPVSTGTTSKKKKKINKANYWLYWCRIMEERRLQLSTEGACMNLFFLHVLIVPRMFVSYHDMWALSRFARVSNDAGLWTEAGNRAPFKKPSLLYGAVLNDDYAFHLKTGAFLCPWQEKKAAQESVHLFRFSFAFVFRNNHFMLSLWKHGSDLNCASEGQTLFWSVIYLCRYGDLEVL